MKFVELILPFLVLGFVACVPKAENKSHTKDFPAPNSVSKASSNAALNVAILGDSQTAGEYGRRLAERVLKDSKQRLLFFGGASSARIHHWIDGGFSAIPSDFFRSCESPAQASCSPQMTPGKRTKALKTIMSQFPEIDGYIMTLGDNHYYDPSSVRSFTAEITGILAAAGKKCAFVTPTLALGKFADKTVMINGIKAGLQDTQNKYGTTCSIVDSYNFGGDVVRSQQDKATIESSLQNDYMKLHPAGAGARLWADRVFEKLLAIGLLN